jgi:transposase
MTGMLFDPPEHVVHELPALERVAKGLAAEGYHSHDGLKEPDSGPWRARIAEPEPAKGYLRWHGDDDARAAVYGNRSQLKSGVDKEAMRKRGEMVERSFAVILDRGGMRRPWLRGRENVQKRYLTHIAGFNLGILMRVLFGQGTPREAPSARSATLFVVQTDSALAFIVISDIHGETAMLAAISFPRPYDRKRLRHRAASASRHCL